MVTNSPTSKSNLWEEFTGERMYVKVLGVSNTFSAICHS
jgi:hypothetical protein